MEGYGCLEKWGDLNFNGGEDYQEDEEEETLSLCDLPVCVSVTKEENEEEIKAKETTKLLNCEENFDFCSWGGTVLMESEMCAADEVFFQGQILPLRLSVSSENGAKLESKNTISTAESMERCSSSGVTSLSSRSNSTGSHNSNSTTTTITTTTTSTYKPKFRNQFHSHPSPKPQIISISKVGNMSNRSRKASSNIWGIFKVGLIRTPEMELQELKLRNSRSSSGSSSKMSHLEMKTEEKKTVKKKKTERFGMFEGCKCSPDTVDTVIIRKNKKIISKEEDDDEVENKEEKTEKQRKQGLHHRRTFEWLRELSIADVPE